MQIIELLPHDYCKGRFLKINSIAVRWEGKILTAILVFHVTRDRTETKVAGIKIFAENTATLEKMLLEVAELYPVREKMAVCIPESEQEGELWSYYNKGDC